MVAVPLTKPIDRRILRKGQQRVDAVGAEPDPRELLGRHVARLSRDLIDDAKHGWHLRLVDSEPIEERTKEASIAHASTDVIRGQPELAHDVDRDGDQLGIGRHVDLANDVDVELKMLAQASLLRSLVSKELRHRKPAHRLAQCIGACRDHPREGRRHLGTQRHLASPFVGEVV